MFLVVIALSYLTLREDDIRLRVAAGALGVAVPGAVQLVVHDDWGWPFWTGGLLVTWLSAEQLRRYRALVAELESTRERLAVQAVHLERRRIAAELHDLVGHSLGVLLLHITGARRRIEDDPAGSAEALRRAESIGRSGLAEIRRSVAALRDETGASLAPAMTAADVPALVGATAAAGCAATLEVSGVAGRDRADHRPRRLPRGPGVAGQRRPARPRCGRPGRDRDPGGRRRRRRWPTAAASAEPAARAVPAAWGWSACANGSRRSAARSPPAPAPAAGGSHATLPRAGVPAPAPADSRRPT